MKRVLFVMIFLAGLGAACSPQTATPVPTLEAPKPTASPAIPPQPTPTVTPAPTATLTREPQPVVYFHFATVESGTFPAGSVELLPGILVLSPGLSRTERSADAVVNIAAALQAAVADARNPWQGELVVSKVSLQQGEALVELSGEVFAPGGAVLNALSWQLVLTVFTEPAVNRAVILLQGKNIANLGISHESELVSNGYAYTRAEVERWMAEHALNP